MKRLLLLSNGHSFGRGYLDHAMPAILEHFGGALHIGFLPFALRDHPAYTARVADRFVREGLEVSPITADAVGASMLQNVDALYVGGGNTFRLLDGLDRASLLEPIRARVLKGMPYLGCSAGTNVAAPTIMTTNDMPIVELRSFAALGLVPFQINPHYFDPDPGSRHMGETRETRLREYLEENDRAVVGVREGGWIKVRDGQATVEGANGARVFERGQEPKEIEAGEVLPWTIT